MLEPVLFMLVRGRQKGEPWSNTKDLMPIPAFDHNGVIPPHLGVPTEWTQTSPYSATAMEICQRFGFSPERRLILNGWLTLREMLRGLGHGDGFQWLDGSFMEDVEKLRGRPPKDIDVVSFLPQSMSLRAPDPRIVALITDSRATKTQLRTDHFIIRLHWHGPVLIDHTRYWCGLFSHRRDDGVHKGMVRVDLSNEADDADARSYLRSLDPL